MTTDRLEFTRQSERRTSDDKLRAGLEFIAETALKKYSGWDYKIGTLNAWERSCLYFKSCPDSVREDMANSPHAQWHFSSWIEFTRTQPASKDPHTAELREAIQRKEIYERAAMTGHSQRFGTHPWVTKLESSDRQVEMMIVTGGGDDIDKETEEVEIDFIADVEPTPLSAIEQIKQGDFYSHLFGLDAQIRILLSAIQAAADSGMENRFHSLLHGAPGAGKTDVLLSTHKLLTSMNISCLSIDATSTTEAGMRKLLLDEDEILPEVILVEEIEKAAHSFKLLLGLMDDRGKVTQLNARRSASRSVKALVLASANDYGMLVKMDSGALLSRFNNEIFCPRPDREILGKILERDVSKVKGGNLAWIEPALVFCYDMRGITDPRQLRRVALCGKERLLTGEYQLDLERTMKKVETPKGNGRASNILDMGDI